MDWLIWLTAFALTVIPVGGLLLDRLLDLPTRAYLRALGPPWALGIAALLAYAAIAQPGLAALILWGSVGGLLGTIALDAVRLVGVRLGAFPLDMPRMFGVLLAGLAPALQRNMIARMVELTAALPDDGRRAAMAPRVLALARLDARRRAMVATGMVAGLSRLPDERRQAMLRTQLSLVSELPADGRRAVMATMDRAMSAPNGAPYGQPRGMPRMPMARFREMAAVELPRTLQEAAVAPRRVYLVGYVWHFVMGATFGAQYTLLVGSGSLALAVAWGVFVWLAMMVLMPAMMPAIAFPRWFPAVPFLAHVAFALPLAGVALAFVPAAAGSASLIGLLARALAG